MDQNGHIYAGLEDEIPAEDKARLDGYMRGRSDERALKALQEEVFARRLAVQETEIASA